MRWECDVCGEENNDRPTCSNCEARRDEQSKKSPEGLARTDESLQTKTKDSKSWLLIQIAGGIILSVVFIVALISERVFERRFDIFTILGVFLSMGTRILFWIGLGLEEWGRTKRKKQKKL